MAAQTDEGAGSLQRPLGPQGSRTRARLHYFPLFSSNLPRCFHMVWRSGLAGSAAIAHSRVSFAKLSVEGRHVIRHSSPGQTLGKPLAAASVRRRALSGFFDASRAGHSVGQSARYSGLSGERVFPAHEQPGAESSADVDQSEIDSRVEIADTGRKRQSL